LLFGERKNRFIQRIYLDEPFISTNLKRAIAFIKIGLLPELKGKWYSREPSTVPTITLHYSVLTVDDESEDQEQGECCYCRKQVVVKKCCDSKDCPIQ